MCGLKLCSNGDLDITFIHGANKRLDICFKGVIVYRLYIDTVIIGQFVVALNRGGETKSIRDLIYIGNQIVF